MRVASTMRKMKKRTSSGDNGYEEFLSALGSVILGLDKCSATLNRPAYWGLNERRKDTVRTYRTDYKLERVQKSYFNVSAQLRLTIRDSKTDVTVLETECVFYGHIHGKEPINEANAKRFTDSHLRIVMTPYFRQFVSDITARMSIPPIILPFTLASATKIKRREKPPTALADVARPALQS